jgi:arylsulfatase A-like enzyme
LAQACVAALATGLADAAMTLAFGDGLDAARVAGVAVAVIGFDAFVVLAASVPVAAVLALLAPATMAAPRDAVARAARSLWPADPATRARKGIAWLAGASGAAAFLGAINLAALAVIESVRTTTYAATAVAGLALAIGAVVLVLAVAATRRLAAAVPALPRGAWRVPSPLAVVALAAAGTGAVLLAQRENVAAVVGATPLHGPLVLAGGIVAGALASLLPPVASWRRMLRLAVVSGIPLLAVAATVATLFWVGADDTVRRVVSTGGCLSPSAYRALKSVLDVDGDDHLPFMGENDCEPFDPWIHAGAPEVPNNGIDEDCDGTDLDLTYSEEALKPRWDHPVPPGIGRRPSVVLLSIDAIAPSHMASYGYSRETTPFLDSLASVSMLFTDAYSQGPSTRLAIPSMFTSRFDSQIEYPVVPRQPHELLPGNLTWAEVMRAAGYRTVAVLPWAFFRDWKGVTQGFDRVNQDPVDKYKAPLYHNAAQVTDAALAEVRAVAGQSQPVFLWVHWFDPHGPFTAPPEGTAPAFGDSEVDVYDAELAYTDAEVRRFVEGLDAALSPSNTVLVVTGDHGEAFDPAHPKRHHGYDLHSMVLHVPLMIRAPFVAPAKITMPVTPMDLLPTFVNLLDLPGTFAFEGQSLVPQLLGGPADDRRVTFHEFYLPENVYHKKPALRMVGVRTASLYLIQDLSNNTFELYGYRQDPTEGDNRVDEMPEAASILKNELARFMARVAR